ncbi:MAG TPA: amino acid adenylation domain-containing protein, partial [Gammaproteobacteria bacterium]
AFIDKHAAKHLLEQYANLMTGMAREPWRQARDVPYLGDDERAPLQWQGPREQLPSHLTKTLHARFETRAAATPHAIAIRCGDQSMTYAQLNTAANRLAHRLRAEGAKPDTLVGLCVERSLQQITGILGILKSGAAYLPLDPDYPVERLRFQVEDAGVKLVVASTPGRNRLDGCALDFIEPDLHEGDNSNPQSLTNPAHLAYVIYTSGSTGQPKGVMVTHHNVIRLFDTNASWLNAGSNDVWSLFHSFAFDFSVWEIWGALLHGGCLEVIPREIARSPEAFHDLLIERGVTVLNQTPSAFRQLMQVDAEREEALPALRMIVFGGEKLDFASLGDWVQRHGTDSPQLINMYGITETTVHVTWRPLRRSDVETPPAGSMIGWPLPDLYVRLLDAKGRPVPPGVRGEICVGGAGVARGYLNRPKLSAERFVRDPYSGDDDARLYRSGDFARRMPNGELCYLGREDDQVKIRGFRIDLGEIVAALRGIDGIADAVVVPRKSSHGEARLFAYYTSATARGRKSESELRMQLAKQLPEHMLPAQLINLPEIPVNANNKVDFKALPDPAEITKEETQSAGAPRTPGEELFVQLWQQVLERRDVGRDDDFFGLGGDSILALQLVSRARAAGVDLVPRDVFNHPVLADMAGNVKTVSSRDLGEEADVEVEGSWTLTPVQHWFFEQAFDNPDHWNEAFMFRVPPDTDVDLLERAMLEVVRHHDALHVRFVHGDGGQWHAESVEPGEALEFSRIELDHLDEDERREAADLITGDIQGSLSLSGGLLVRAAHFTGGLEDGARLLIVVHQLAIDAASWSILLQDLDTAYRALKAGALKAGALKAGKEVVLPSRTCSYGRWAQQLRRQASSASVAGEYAYWQRVMQAGSESPLQDAVREPGREADAREYRVAIDAPETSALLGDIHHAYGTDVHELLIAALSRAVADQWPQNAQLRLDLQRHGRDDEFDNLDVSRTVGWFSVLHPLALDQAVTRNPGRLICDVKTRVRSAPHHGAGFGLLRYLRPSGATGFGKGAALRAPILFNYLGHFERVLDNGMFQHVIDNAGPVHGRENHLTHPLTITALIHDDRMEFEFRYSPAAIADAVIESLAARFTHSVKDLIRHCRTLDGITRTPVDFPLAHLTQDELDRFPVALENAEDILPLSPLQRLYHALSGTDKDVGFDQWVFHLQGRIDETAFEAAWQELLRRHDALRTVFVDEGLSEAHQVVLREVPFRLQRTDWRLLDETAQQQRLEEFLAADRRQGFETSVAPLTRATLIRSGDRHWILVWSHHQALVDGWSWPVMAKELGELHDAILAKRKPDLAAAGSYRSYIAWWMDRDRSDYARFWREQLGAGGAARSLITRSRRKDDGNPGPRDRRRTEFHLSENSSRAVTQLARQLRLTPSVVFQAAWALLLSALTRRFDVTMGVAFSGRTAGIPVPAHTVGPFVNDLPVRVRIGPTERLDNWLANLRSMQADLNHYQNVSPLEVHEWSGTPASMRLFDTLIVFQNYATGDATRRWGENIQLERFSAGVRTNYPLTIAVTPGKRYRIEFHYDKNAIDADAVDALASDLQTILDAMTRTPDVHIATIINHLSPDSKPDEENGSSRRSRKGRWMRRAGDTEQSVDNTHESDAQPAAVSDLQRQVAAVCREVIGVGDLDVERNFFDIGAQSVALLEIHGRLQKRLKRRFPIVKLFQHPTIAALSRYLESGEHEARLHDTASRAAEQRAALRRRRATWQTGGFDR